MDRLRRIWLFARMFWKLSRSPASVDMVYFIVLREWPDHTWTFAYHGVRTRPDDVALIEAMTMAAAEVLTARLKMSGHQVTQHRKGEPT